MTNAFFTGDADYVAPSDEFRTRQEAAPRLPGRPELVSQVSGVFGPAKLELRGTGDKFQLYAGDPGMFSGVDVRASRAGLVRFAREVLAYLGADARPQLPAWQPGQPRRRTPALVVARGSGAEFDAIPVADRYHYGAGGNLVRYASMEAAQHAADKLNAAEAQS